MILTTTRPVVSEIIYLIKIDTAATDRQTNRRQINGKGRLLFSYAKEGKKRPKKVLKNTTKKEVKKSHTKCTKRLEKRAASFI